MAADIRQQKARGELRQDVVCVAQSRAHSYHRLGKGKVVPDTWTVEFELLYFMANVYTFDKRILTDQSILSIS